MMDRRLRMIVALFASACTTTPPASDSSVADAIDASSDAGLPARCRTAYREVERASFTASPPSAFVTQPLFADGALWFSVDRGENTGTGSYDGRVVVARGWGNAPTVAFTTATLPRSSQRIRFSQSNTGAPVAGLQGPFDPRSGARWQTGGPMFGPTTLFVALAAETWFIRGAQATNRLFIDRFEPMTAAPAATPALLGSVEVRAFSPTMATSLSYSIYRAPNGERTFVVVDRAGESSSIRALDGAMRPIGDQLSTIAWHGTNADNRGTVLVNNAGLWMLEFELTTDGVLHALHNIANDGRDRVVSSFTTTYAIDRMAELQSVSDDLIALRVDARIELRDPRTGSVLQRFDDAFAAALDGDSLFLIKGGASMADGEVVVRRLVCN